VSGTVFIARGGEGSEWHCLLRGEGSLVSGTVFIARGG